LRATIERRIQDLGLQSRVRITGWIDSATVRQEIADCRVLVQPSFQEGLPVVLMEAMALGRPVISTYVAGIPELVSPESGWLVPSGDANSLADAMTRSLEASSEEMRCRGAVAQKIARERHSIDSEAAKLAALFAKTT
jgi:colanic acid/amylovoran biosynthesis glycosyltransferase